MSLAMMAAPIEENDNYNLQSSNRNTRNDNLIQKKRNHNKTQKRNINENFSINSEKVNNVLKSLHTNSNSNEDENINNSDLGDFKPLEPPQSVGVEKTKKENMQNIYNPEPSNIDNDDLQNYNDNFMNDEQVRNYYKNLVPNFNPSKYNETMKYFSDNFYKNSNFLKNSFNNLNNENNSNNLQTLINKINYIINLLEEQQDQRTNNVTEEVVLYSFLGIFIIFIVDSFARVGKYVR